MRIYTVVYNVSPRPALQITAEPKYNMSLKYVGPLDVVVLGLHEA